MSKFTYMFPDEIKFYNGILMELKLNKREDLIGYLKGGCLTFEDTGTFSPYFKGGGRSDAMGAYVKFHINPYYIEVFQDQETDKLLTNICDRLMPADRGYDIKGVEFITDIEGNYDLVEDLIEDLNFKADNLSQEILKELLPQDLKEKGFYMAEVYTYLYCIENSLRLFVEKV